MTGSPGGAMSMLLDLQLERSKNAPLIVYLDCLGPDSDNLTKYLANTIAASTSYRGPDHDLEYETCTSHPLVLCIHHTSNASHLIMRSLPKRFQIKHPIHKPCSRHILSRIASRHCMDTL